MTIATSIARLCAIACLAATAAHAAYPDRPVRLVVPLPPGGGADTVARLLAAELQAEYGQPFVVENKPGANSNIGLEAVARAAPDGYTLIMAPNQIAINQTLMAGRSVSLSRLAPVVLAARPPIVVAGRPSLPIRTLPELIAYAKRNPGKLTYTSCGVGSIQHLAAEVFQAEAGISMVHVPYKGCADAIPNVLGGQVDLLFNAIGNLNAFFKDGRLVPYAVTTAKRSDIAPDIPTVSEAGVKDYDLDGWFGLMAPANTPKDVIDRLNASVNAIMQQPRVRAKMAESFFEPVGGSAAHFRKVLDADVARFAEIIKVKQIHGD
ncbi:Tripartite tricarboxylate transporter family receptor [Pigmentiphaga humi]|uniref:Tripartite tricarboxylate transporter family receptor n=1 Tax=Pigmentiphaga humi TaxID=2478468 RepID=A0A3P4AYY7_9BURK|nr:tripartite tricarboxylate transporter substrate binding protein [Pigmentiphaga humi]VCU69299.1 Tripartite tricarboxylate transporter family receptor [Pigmentiphaga humi]